jgi:succinate dehydrogenase / fumarate reductase, flavoprotein subunit
MTAASVRAARTHEVVVVGGGLAGLMAAMQLRDRDVAIASKVYPTQSHSGAAQGGFNAARAETDSVASHVFDTIKGSDFLADQDAVQVMCGEAAQVIDEIDRLGALWSRTDDGRIAQRPLGGSSHARSCYAADLSGHIVLHTLYQQVMRASIPLYPEWHLLHVLVEGGRAAGAVFWNLPDGRLEVVRARAVILATGGYGRIYAKSTNGLGSVGDGVALAYRAGAVISDPEFVQFHPTTLYGTNVLVSEGARGEGGHLRNARNERFMSAYAPNAIELAPRDVVSRAIASEIREGRGFPGGYVHLDLTHLGRDVIQSRLPQVCELARNYAGVDAACEPLPVEPAQHYSMGGVRTDSDGVTTIPGLFAAGECANVSVHGANRLGGNSLLETVVFGRRAGRRVAYWIEGEDAAPEPRASLAAFEDTWASRLDGNRSSVESARGAAVIRRRLTAVMTEKVGVFRVGGELEDAAAELDMLAGEYECLRTPPPAGPFDYAFIAFWEAGLLLDVARMVTRAALRRTESRGAHFRADYPIRDDARWLHHTFVLKGTDGPRLEHGPVRLGEVVPQARTY